jgi:hypothetical protein
MKGKDQVESNKVKQKKRKKELKTIIRRIIYERKNRSKNWKG